MRFTNDDIAYTPNHRYKTSKLKDILLQRMRKFNFKDRLGMCIFCIFKYFVKTTKNAFPKPIFEIEFAHSLE